MGTNNNINRAGAHLFSDNLLFFLGFEPRNRFNVNRTVGESVFKRSSVLFRQ